MRRFDWKCCCFGVVLSALLPWGVLLWGESRVGKTFSLPSVTYRLPEEQAAPESLEMAQVLFLLTEGDPEVTNTIEPTEIDAFSLMDGVREEIAALQHLGVLPAGDPSFLQSRPAMSLRYSLPDVGTVSLWEFTAFFGGETVRLRYHPASGRILALECAIDGDGSSLLNGYGRYLEDSRLPAQVRLETDGAVAFLSAGYLEDT